MSQVESSAADRRDTIEQARQAFALAEEVGGFGARGDYQQILSRLGTQALPPEGHLCSYCNRPLDLYCLAVAIERLRGLRPEKG